MEETISKNDLLKYGYYEEDNKDEYIVVLNYENIKEFFKADRVVFEEPYKKEIYNG